MDCAFPWLFTLGLALVLLPVGKCQLSVYVVAYNKHVKGGTYHANYPNQSKCVAACRKSNQCTGVDYDSNGGCWFHTSNTVCNTQFPQPGVTHIRLRSCSTNVVNLQSQGIQRPQSVRGGAVNGVLSIEQGRHAHGGIRKGVMTTQTCINFCKGRPGCYAVDTDSADSSCWVHTINTACGTLKVNPLTTHYTVRECSSSSMTAAHIQAAAMAASMALGNVAPQSSAVSNNRVRAPQCGRPHFSPIGGRIVGGQESTPHSWPWQVGLQHKAERVVRCGGALITNQWILTTSHCVDEDANPSNWEVILGAHDLKRRERSRIVRGVSKIIYHPNFALKTFDYDIALLKLSQPVTLGTNINTVCLPRQGASIPDGSVCTATGWGNPGKARRPLEQANLPIISLSKCRQTAWLGSQFLITKRMICAGYEYGGTDSCQGDSGGPLVCFQGSQWVQHGITSFGRGCGLPRKPGVYTRVSELSDWIRNSLSRN